MKKVFAAILAFALTLGLCACGVDTPDETVGSTPAATTTVAPTTTVPPATVPSIEGVFSAGYGKTDITPEESVPLRGDGKSDLRISQFVLSNLYATCLAVTDADGNTVLLFGLDLVNYSPDIMPPIMKSVSEATGVPVGNICFSASHNHSAPDIDNTKHDSIVKYNKMLEQRLVEAAVMAMSDRRPAEMFGATVETESLNFVRRYLCKDGSYLGDNFGGGSLPVAHESEADASLQLIKFVREGGKDIIMTNFQVHPLHIAWGLRTAVTSDVVGLYRDALSEKLDCEVIYFTGASGNITVTTRLYNEKEVSYLQYGETMAGYALSAEESYRPIATGKVQVSTYDFAAEVNHDATAEQAALCKDLYTRWGVGEISTEELIKIGADNGITLHSAFHARAIYQRAELEETNPLEMTVFSFGDAGFVVAPYEMFDTNGVFIKENSPFEMTFIATQANGYHSYIPSKLAWPHGGYEVDNCRYVEGTAEALADQYVAMLTELYQSR